MTHGRKTGGRNFQKGHPPMPGGGRPRTPADLIPIQAMPIEEGRRRMTMMSKLSLKELEAIAENKDSIVLDVCIATALIRGIKDGNLQSLSIVWDRLWGKPKETTENLNLSVNAELDAIPEDVLVELLRARNAANGV
jgi:hypothetical protein